MSLNIDEATLKSVVEDVLKKLGQQAAAPAGKSSDCGCSGKSSQGRDGVFQDAGEAAEAASHAQKELRKLGIAGATRSSTWSSTPAPRRRKSGASSSLKRRKSDAWSTRWPSCKASPACPASSG